MNIPKLLRILAYAAVAHAVLIEIPNKPVATPTDAKRGSFPLPEVAQNPQSKSPDLVITVVTMSEQQASPTVLVDEHSLGSSYRTGIHLELTATTFDIQTRTCRIVDKATYPGLPAYPTRNVRQADAPNGGYIVCPTTTEAVVGELDARPIATLYTTVIRLSR
jgi:hypothetical protein